MPPRTLSEVNDETKAERILSGSSNNQGNYIQASASDVQVMTKSEKHIRKNRCIRQAQSSHSHHHSKNTSIDKQVTNIVVEIKKEPEIQKEEVDITNVEEQQVEIENVISKQMPSNFRCIE